MKWIGQRISYIDKDSKTTFVIEPEQVGWVKGAMGAWFAMWLVIGLVMIWAWASGTIYDLDPTDDKVPTESQKQQLMLITIIFLCFWVYYFQRVGRSFFWLMFGKEMLKVDKISLTIKNSIRGYGRAKEYYLENISKIRIFVPEKNSFQTAWENSPWIRGGERIEFDYMGKTVRVGRKLDEKDAKLLFQVLTKRVEEQLRKK